MLVEVMNEVIKECTRNSTEINNVDTEVPNYHKPSKTNIKEVSKRVNECNKGAGNAD